MPGNISGNRNEEARHLPQVIAAVIEAGYHQRDHLNPHAQLGGQRDAVQHHLQAPAQFPILPIGDAFQVNLETVQHRLQGAQNLRRGKSVGHVHAAQALFSGPLENV